MGLKGAMGAAAGLLNAAILSLNEFDVGLPATGGGPGLRAALAGGDVGLIAAGWAGAGCGAGGGLLASIGSCSGGEACED